MAHVSYFSLLPPDLRKHVECTLRRTASQMRVVSDAKRCDSGFQLQHAGPLEARIWEQQNELRRHQACAEAEAWVMLDVMLGMRYIDEFWDLVLGRVPTFEECDHSDVAMGICAARAGRTYKDWHIFYQPTSWRVFTHAYDGETRRLCAAKWSEQPHARYELERETDALLNTRYYREKRYRIGV